MARAEKRLWVVGSAFALGLAALVVRAAQVQLLQGAEYAARAAAQRTDSVILPAPRGALYDRTGVPLAATTEHIEIQVLADQFGDTIYLGERECSLQRRHQKLLEESPSPFIDDDEDLRSRIGQVAVRAAQSEGYLNAGTIEFLRQG